MARPQLRRRVASQGAPRRRIRIRSDLARAEPWPQLRVILECDGRRPQPRSPLGGGLRSHAALACGYVPDERSRGEVSAALPWIDVHGVRALRAPRAPASAPVPVPAGRARPHPLLLAAALAFG